MITRWIIIISYSCLRKSNTRSICIFDMWEDEISSEIYVTYNPKRFVCFIIHFHYNISIQYFHAMVFQYAYKQYIRKNYIQSYKVFQSKEVFYTLSRSLTQNVHVPWGGFGLTYNGCPFQFQSFCSEIATQFLGLKAQAADPPRSYPRILPIRLSFPAYLH